MAYAGSIDLISGLRPKNNGTFPLINAPDVLVNEESGARLDEALAATDEHFKDVSVDPTSGTMTFTRESGETVEVTPQPAIEAGDGIEVSGNTVSLPQAFYDYLVEETFETPAIAEFTIMDPYPYRIGEGVTVDHLSHRETNVGNITGNLTLRYENTTLLSDIAPSAAAVTIDFAAQTFTRDTAGTMTFTLSGTNARGHAFSKTASKTFFVPKFLGSSAAASVSAQDILNMRSAQNVPENMTLSETEYIYFVTDGTISAVKDALTGFGVPIEEAVVTEVSINGIAVNYNVYRTSNRIVAGAYRFVIS